MYNFFGLQDTVAAKMSFFSVLFVWNFWHFLICIDNCFERISCRSMIKQIQINLQK